MRGVGQDAVDGWTIKDDLVQDNPYGAEVQITSNSIVTDNCLRNNGEYGYTAEGENGTEHNATLTNNDITANNTAGYYDVPGSNHPVWMLGRRQVLADDRRHGHGQLHPQQHWPRRLGRHR